MKIAFVHYPGRLSRLDAARAGTAPTEFLFGAIELERSGHEIRHWWTGSARSQSTVRWWMRVPARGHRRISPPSSGGAETLATLRAADVSWP
jgi:hypothetical protein